MITNEWWIFSLLNTHIYIHVLGIWQVTVVLHNLEVIMWLFWSSFSPKTVVEVRHIICEEFLIPRHTNLLYAKNLGASFSSDKHVMHGYWATDIPRTQQHISHAKFHWKSVLNEEIHVHVPVNKYYNVETDQVHSTSQRDCSIIHSVRAWSTVMHITCNVHGVSAHPTRKYMKMRVITCSMVWFDAIWGTSRVRIVSHFYQLDFNYYHLQYFKW